MIAKRITLLSILMLFVTSCYHYKKSVEPKDLISKTKMIDVLIDLKLVASVNSVNKKAVTKNNLKPETYVFLKYNIDSLQFVNSNNYYASNVKEYEHIYSQVKDSLEKLKAIYRELQLKEDLEAKEQIKKDSIEAIQKTKSSLDILK